MMMTMLCYTLLMLKLLLLRCNNSGQAFNLYFYLITFNWMKLKNIRSLWLGWTGWLSWVLVHCGECNCARLSGGFLCTVHTFEWMMILDGVNKRAEHCVPCSKEFQEKSKLLWSLWLLLSSIAIRYSIQFPGAHYEHIIPWNRSWHKLSCFSINYLGNYTTDLGRTHELCNRSNYTPLNSRPCWLPVSNTDLDRKPRTLIYSSSLRESVFLDNP